MGLLNDDEVSLSFCLLFNLELSLGKGIIRPRTNHNSLMDFYSRGLHSFTTLGFTVVEISRSVSVFDGVESEGQDLRHWHHRLCDDSPIIFYCGLTPLHSLDQLNDVVAMVWFWKVRLAKGD
jgi:hypothetical protein